MNDNAVPFGQAGAKYGKNKGHYHRPARNQAVMNDNSLTHQSALLYLLVLVAAADSDMTDREIESIEQAVRTAPIFVGFDETMLAAADEAVAEILSEENGLQSVIDLVRSSLPEPLYDTAYALSCQVAAVDGQLSQEELRLLEMIRHGLEIDRLSAAAIEKGVAALQRTWPIT